MEDDVFRRDLNKTMNNKQQYSFLDCKVQLMMDFPNILAYNIHSILVFHNGQYAQTYKALTIIMGEISRKYPDFGKQQDPKTVCTIRMAMTNDRGQSGIFTFNTMCNARPCLSRKSVPLLLKDEMKLIQEQIKTQNEETDRKFAVSVLEEDYQEMGQLIECACCFGKCAFDNMAQCMEGHLVCVECLNAFTRESVYGMGKISLECMTSECTAVYSEGELKRCLSAATWGKLEERTLTENLNMAEVEDLVKCPHCDFAAILSPRAKVFHCYRDTCNKETCRDCGIDWVGHEGLPCKAVESKDETSLRKEFEEKMTKAKVRTCKSCKAEFTKDSGCNKMTCRCGMTMCYICRTSRIAYDHFCKHPLSPGKSCRQCTACSLWTNPEMDEERAMDEIRKEAQSKRKDLGFGDVKLIGAPIGNKKPKTKK